MAFIRFNTGAGGTDGTTVTPANSGGASGNAFTTVNSAVKFTRAHTPFGSGLCYGVTSPATLSTYWTVSPSITTDLWMSSWVYMDSDAPTSLSTVHTTFPSNSVTGSYFQTNNRLTAGNNSVNVSGSVYPPRTWYRIVTQFHWTDAVNGIVIVNSYDRLGNHIETITSSSHAWTAIANSGFFFQACNMYQAYLAVSTQGVPRWPGILQQF